MTLHGTNDIFRVRTHCSGPEEDGSGDADCRQVGVGATIVSGVDATPNFEVSEHVFDLVALSVEDWVIGDHDLRLDFEGMKPEKPRWAVRNQSAS
jgi:hypothetical protein